MDHVELRFSALEIEALADTIADKLFDAIFDCAIKKYPWDAPVTPGMEALADQVLKAAASKFYERCS